MKIVPATDLNVAEIVDIWKEFMDFHSDIDPFITRRDDGHKIFEKFVRENIESDDSLVLVATDSDNVIGFSLVFISNRPPVLKSEKYGFIDDMAVRSGYRRMGAGTAMLAKINEWFESKDITRIELNVIPNNREGYSFWAKNGFRVFRHTLYMDKK
jgi:ribosomal protein S18 acetylase RimI-like enzyme